MLVEYKVGEIFPDKDVLLKFNMINGGGSLSYNKEYKSLILYVALQHPTDEEIEAFRKGNIEFGLYDNKELDTSIILMDFDGVFDIDLIYNINILDEEVDGIVESNAFNMFLIDSATGILHGIRTIGLGQKFMKEINRIVRNDKRYTTAMYNNWLMFDIYSTDLCNLWNKARIVDWRE